VSQADGRLLLQSSSAVKARDHSGDCETRGLPSSFQFLLGQRSRFRPSCEGGNDLNAAAFAGRRAHRSSKADGPRKAERRSRPAEFQRESGCAGNRFYSEGTPSSGKSLLRRNSRDEIHRLLPMQKAAHAPPRESAAAFLFSKGTGRSGTVRTSHARLAPRNRYRRCNAARTVQTDRRADPKKQACDQNRHALETASRRRPIPKAQSRAINPVSPLLGFRELKTRAPGRPPVRGRPSFRRTHSQKLGRSKRSACISKGIFGNSRSDRPEVKSGRRGIGAQRAPEQNSEAAGHGRSETLRSISTAGFGRKVYRRIPPRQGAGPSIESEIGR